MKTIFEFAPAKLNLYLHITGRKEDGYHDLDSLVAFATLGDDVQLRPSSDFGFSVEGPHAAALANEDHENNLIVKAARSLAALTGNNMNAHFTLVKNLPVASGIGGGSSDAAAALRALARHWNLKKDDPRIMEAAAQHGQDVPVCVMTENCYITAKGVAPSPVLPRADVILVNPNKPMPTPEVYKEYRNGSDPFSPNARFENTPDNIKQLVDALKLRSNDLYAPAMRLMPDITKVVEAISATENCMLSRMSGSGATCFGIYPNYIASRNAADFIRRNHPDWWVEAAVINA